MDIKADAEWIRALQQELQAKIAVIIHTQDDPRQYVNVLEKEGLSITHTFRLTKTIAANGPAQIVLDLLQASWVSKIEPDQTITTMKHTTTKRGNI